LNINVIILTEFMELFHCRPRQYLR
jgi:hypothetical protein